MGDNPRYGDRDDKQLLTQNGHARETEAYQGIISQLFSTKARTASLADKQLEGLFPGAGKHEHGRSIRAGLSAQEASRRAATTFKRRR